LKVNVCEANENTNQVAQQGVATDRLRSEDGITKKIIYCKTQQQKNTTDNFGRMQEHKLNQVK